ncbi:hypothetical protein CLIB1423_05S06634 [[Candida] railenensis]|uniref:Vta1 C-terminal domain-containing protein n=1 Tax=[Candida] railenensis TaxID=45579 RepID=A0A9P0QNT0_9ASCO|nr:hypothetical protein CLIB1423_05S06634 [[Candida] railenensis]
MIHSLKFPDDENSKLPNLYLSKCQHYSQTNPLFSYFCGMYSIQTALMLLGSTDLAEEQSIEITITKLLEYLEDIKRTKIPKNIDSSLKLRLEYSKLLDKKYQKLTSLINMSSGNSEHLNFGQVVDLFLELAFLYDVLRGVYPIKNFSEDEAAVKTLLRDCSDEAIEYRIHYCRTQASSILSLVKSGQDPNQYMEQLRIVPTDLDQINNEDDGITKIQIDDMIKQVMDLPDDAFEENESEVSAKSDKSDEESGNESENDSISSDSKPRKRPDVNDLPSVPKSGRNVEESTEDSHPTVSKPQHQTTESHEHPIGSDNNDKTSTKRERNGDKEPLSDKSSSFKSSPSPPPSSIPVFTHKKQIHYSQEEMKAIMENDNLLDLAMKDAKHAVSALNYEDCDTALSKLEEAISLIKEYKLKNS